MKILVVCMGNICRSPMAEAVVRHMLERDGLAADTTVDSAGTHISMSACRQIRERA